MPSWEPNWEDVRWDHGAAQGAISALRQAADLLDQRADERARVARDATEQWRGRYREEFDDHLNQMLRRAHDLASECRDKSNEIARADQRAFDEQRRRVRERERWLREKRDEDRERQRQQ
jgi:uncharacterized protein YukE